MEKGKNNNNADDSGETKGSNPVGRVPPNALVSEQIAIIQMITEKLKTAFNGGDVQWVQEVGECL